MALLCRVFRPDQIYLSPLQITNKEEIADIMVVADSHLLLIQAKDSPNTERTLRQGMARKRAHSSQKLKAALSQMKGAIKYVRSHSPLAFFIGEEKHELSVDHLDVATLLVLKELFNSDFEEYSDQILALVNDLGIPCIVLDYGELSLYTAHLPTEPLFFEAYYRVITTGIDRGVLPRLRLGMIGPNEQ